MHPAMLVGKYLPRRWGLKIAAFIGTFLGSLRHSKMVRAIRANQYVIHNQQLDPRSLNQVPKKVFRSATKCFYDYLYYLPRPEDLRETVHFSPEAGVAFDRIRNLQASVVVCPHLSNFDLMGYALALNEINVQVLSFPNPKNSYKLQNELRKSTGINVTPLNLTTFRQARQRLAAGGSILTGLDRPLDESHLEKYRPEFFGYETRLPVTYVRMAIEAEAPVFVVAATSQPDGTYLLVSSPPIWMEPAADLKTEVITNANRVLKAAEEIILTYSSQWAMFYPIWPQFLGV